jgi:hypothetical protein
MIIPSYHRLQLPPEVIPTAPAYSLRVQDAGPKTQNYDKGFDGFIRKFDPGEEMRATMALFSGHHGDHGCAVYCTQRSRRCCLLHTTYSLTTKRRCGQV